MNLAEMPQLSPTRPGHGLGCHGAWSTWAAGMDLGALPPLSDAGVLRGNHYRPGTMTDCGVWPALARAFQSQT